MRLGHVLGALVMMASLAAVGRAEPVTDLSDGRTGAIDFHSLTPSSPIQLMAGAGKPAVVRGTLNLPLNDGRMAAMVIAHGSGGIRDDREWAWAERLGRLGVATFVVDSFGSRGIRSTATDQSQLATAANVADALFALKLLATHPRIDARRIGVMGFSKGGQVAIYTALEPFRRSVLGEGPRFVLHLSFYSSCSLPYLTKEVSQAPMVFLLGGADDYTPAEHCQRYADWFRSKGSETRVIVFGGAHHGFDIAAPVRKLPRVETARACGLDIELEPVVGRRWDNGAIVPNGRISAYIKACMGRGASFGGNEDALRGAIEEVRRAIAAHLLPR